jgi:hypothetical protein
MLTYQLVTMSKGEGIMLGAVYSPPLNSLYIKERGSGNFLRDGFFCLEAEFSTELMLLLKEIVN